jgi:hypothetical protein
MHFFRWFLFILALSSCAKPNRAVVTPAADGTADCPARFEKLNACVRWTWVAQPSDDEAELDWQILPAVKVISAKVEITMPSMTHPNPPTITEQTRPGQFKTTQILFLMRGEWKVYLRVQLEDGSWDQAKIDVAF